MWKLGIYRLDQCPGHLGAEVPWGRRNRLSYQLLRTSVPPSSLEVAVFESIMYDFQLSGGVFRTTARGRFRDLDDLVNRVLARHFDPADTLLVQDWAASDCVTSVEWYGVLARSFPNVRLTASDMNLFLVEVQFPGGRVYIFEANGNPLQYVRRPFVIDLCQPEAGRYLINRFLRSRALARLARWRKTYGLDFASLNFGPGEDRLHRPPLVFSRIPLIHPAAQALHESPASFRIEPHSVFQPLAEGSHVIRAMNIFNFAYFDAARLAEGVASVWKSLSPQGIWIVGRTMVDVDRNSEKPPTHASIFRKTAAGFELMERCTEKSEIEDLALSIRM